MARHLPSSHTECTALYPRRWQHSISNQSICFLQIIDSIINFLTPLIKLSRYCNWATPYFIIVIRAWTSSETCQLVFSSHAEYRSEGWTGLTISRLEVRGELAWTAKWPRKLGVGGKKKAGTVMQFWRSCCYSVRNATDRVFRVSFSEDALFLLT
jgi:hypothetical protein